MQFNKIINVPNLLTIIRLVLSPIMLPFLLVYLLPFNHFWLNFVLAILFCLFSITDFLDGFLARRYGQVSSFGRFLDPIADKFLVFSSLIALLTIGKIYFVIVLIFIGREFFVLSLRQLALENNFSVHVSWLGKLKTFFQLAYITILILNPNHAIGNAGVPFVFAEFRVAPTWFLIEISLMIGAVLLTLISARDYYLSFVSSYNMKHLNSL